MELSGERNLLKGVSGRESRLDDNGRRKGSSNGIEFEKLVLRWY